MIVNISMDFCQLAAGWPRAANKPPAKAREAFQRARELFPAALSRAGASVGRLRALAGLRPVPAGEHVAGSAGGPARGRLGGGAFRVRPRCGLGRANPGAGAPYLVRHL